MTIYPDPMCERVRIGFYAAFAVTIFEIDILLRIYRFLINIWDNLTIFVFNEDF